MGPHARRTGTRSALCLHFDKNNKFQLSYLILEMYSGPTVPWPAAPSPRGMAHLAAPGGPSTEIGEKRTEVAAPGGGRVPQKWSHKPHSESPFGGWAGQSRWWRVSAVGGAWCTYQGAILGMVPRQGGASMRPVAGFGGETHSLSFLNFVSESPPAAAIPCSFTPNSR